MRLPTHVATSWLVRGLTLALAATPARAGEAVLAGDPPPAPAARPAAPAPTGGVVRLSDFRALLTQLTEQLRTRKTSSEDLVASLGAIAAAYPKFAPDLVKDRKSGLEVEQSPEQFKADALDARKDAERLYLRCLELAKPKPGTEENERDGVNLAAARALETVRVEAREQVIKDLATLVEKVLPQNARSQHYRIPSALYEAVFRTVGRIADGKNGGIAYLQGWIRFDATGDVPDMTKAALDAMTVVPRDREHLSGKLRADLFGDMVRTYVGPENLAEHYRTGTNPNGTRIADPRVTWNLLRPSVIRTLQYVSLEPKESGSTLIASVAKFERWQRDHRDLHRDPWLDPPPTATPPR